MKKNGIAPEYIYSHVHGTNNMTEIKSMMGSKVMDIPSIITLNSEDIIYYQKDNNEQINISQEKLNSINFSLVNEKADNHSIRKDTSESEGMIETYTPWVMVINAKNILRNYIFHKIKQSRAFEKVTNSSTYTLSVNDSIYSYIDNNIIDRYDLSNIVLYIDYKSLTDENNLKRYEVSYKSDINKNEFTKFRKEFNSDKSVINIYFRQEKLSVDYTFDYYFNLIYNKI